MTNERDTLTVKEAADLIQVSVRTIRRYLADGLLVPEVVKGKGGETFRLQRADVLAVQGARKEVIEQARTSPVSKLAGEVQELRRVIEQLRDEQRIMRDQLDRLELRGQQKTCDQ